MNREAFLTLIKEFLGYPACNYQGAQKGNTEIGFDCSGFVNFVLKKAKFPGHIPRHSNELFDYFGVLIHEQYRQPGDLVFFSHKGGLVANHVGLLVSLDDYIHSPGKNGCVICLEPLRCDVIVPRQSGNPIYFFNPIGFKRITVKDGRYQKFFLD